MSSASFARLENGELVFGNALFERRYSVREGQLFPHAFSALGQNWMREPSLLAAPLPPGETPQGQAQLHLEWRDGAPVGAPFLEARLQIGAVTHEFRVWEHVVGFAARSIFPVGAVSGATATEEGPSGVEVDAPKATSPAVKPESDVLESLALPRGHFRLIAAQLRDQTDVHAELLSEGEWLLHTNEINLRLRGNAFAIEDVFDGRGLVFLKHSPLPDSRPVGCDFDLRLKNRDALSLHGHGALEGEGDWWTVFAYEGSRAGRIAATQNYQRGWRRYQSGRDGTLLSNTWGDRNRDARIEAEFIAQEIEAGARLGVDVVQIDDGWEKGITQNSALAAQHGGGNTQGAWDGFWAADPNFWSVRQERFPDGLEPLIARARENGMKFGLWFAPDSSGDGRNWERDAAAILRLHRELGVHYIKIDALKLSSRESQRNLKKFFDRVLQESGGRVCFDLDITAEHRFGYFGLMEPGPLFVENRYTDWGRYWPHHTLRTAWQLSQWVDPARLRFEWLNNSRHLDKYEGDPLAPSQYAPDCLFATTMFFNSLAWFEVSNLPENYVERAAPLIATWKCHRDAIFDGSIVPIGSAPDGVAWTGFVSVNGERSGGYALIFRELNSSPEWEVELPLLQASGGNCEILGGNGEGVWEKGRLRVRLENTLNFVWLRLDE